MQPCFNCTKELLQAKVKSVYYLHPWTYPDAEHDAEYKKLQARFPDGVHKIDMEDPRKDWAVSKRPPRRVEAVPAKKETSSSPTF